MSFLDAVFPPGENGMPWVVDGDKRRVSTNAPSQVFALNATPLSLRCQLVTYLCCELWLRMQRAHRGSGPACVVSAPIPFY